jgi:hypothetical protein
MTGEGLPFSSTVVARKELDGAVRREFRRGGGELEHHHPDRVMRSLVAPSIMVSS